MYFWGDIRKSKNESFFEVRKLKRSGFEDIRILGGSFLGGSIFAWFYCCWFSEYPEYKAAFVSERPKYKTGLCF